MDGGKRATTGENDMPAKKKMNPKKTDARRKTAGKPSARRASAPPAKGGLRLRTVTPSLTVNDIDKSLSWYRDVLGFTVKERWEDEGKLMGVEMASGDVSFFFSQDDWKKGRDRAKGEGFRLYSQTAQDIDSLAAKIKAKGGRLVDEPHDEEWGGRAMTLADPDGFKITVSKG
jgi:lactoylglutathione lyase